jgi:hypothetical protein
MANPTVTVTAEPGNVPPRVRIDVVDTGTPAVTSVTPTRINPDGTSVPVRTQDGVTFPLTTSGSSRVGTLYDYEVPFGQQVTYTLTENPTVAAPATLDVNDVWLYHVGVPSRSMPIIVTEIPTLTRKVLRGVFQPLGNRYPVVNTDGRRKAPQGVLGVRTETGPARLAMEAILDDAQTLLLNVPPSKQWGITTLYIAVDDADENRFLRWGAHPYRNWPLPFIVVDRPEGGTQAQWNLGSVKTSYVTLADIKAAFTNLGELQANTPIGA